MSDTHLPDRRPYHAPKIAVLGVDATRGGTTASVENTLLNTKNIPLS